MFQPFVALLRLSDHTMMMLPVVAPDAQMAVHVAAQVCEQNGHADALITGLLNEADVATLGTLMDKARAQAQRESSGNPENSQS